VYEGTATLEELETWWSIDDVMDAHDVIEAMEEAQARLAPKVPT
jgi:hypothetical protein